MKRFVECFPLIRFVTSVLPVGNEDLKGDEVDKIIKFKSALGIDDPDAASMHMEVNCYAILRVLNGEASP